ncbi:exodeoxyribonuclease V subunit alpha [Aeromicrobium wangtongii]|uniref:RecBCD enzyme subunit RecD n=1 Tax=Aeromicrobium wangtongii TaxID=2969247 RepID=A0ABY5M5Q8_9ACTN|nr:exodeoxyribonuclease V subunit alpha [Aeromicrobium wangtongii]MCD9198301.1 exodeoxyribonuclease V subunit alpha [Aeromicrobium wangtongii]UUP12333.1 exodeoxyribonuclease V subunit alpha [Aeromicrobium wangtongii]
MTELLVIDDPFDRRLALGVTGVLADFNRAGVLTSADVRIAARVSDVVGETSEAVRLAFALTVRAVRNGSTAVELAELADELGAETPDLPWPADPVAWHAEVSRSELVVADVPALRVDDRLVYLDRYFELETELARDLVDRSRLAPPAPDDALLAADLTRLFPGEGYAEQRSAAEGAARRWTTILTGGPGTGKTTALARLLAVLASQATAAGAPPLRVALAAPTGKAAARMKEAVAAVSEAEGFTAEERAWLRSLEASTMHRLLGFRPDNSTRFRHDRRHRLPHDVVVVDESSMVSLTLMTRLVEAVRPDSRLLLVGDPDQLASIEAGTVLRDLVGGWTGQAASPVAHLVSEHRFGDEIGTLAAAVRDGDADRAIEVLRAGHPSVRLVEGDHLADTVQQLVLPGARAMRAAAERGDVEDALAELNRHRLLCAHREGPFGAETWNVQVERWLDEDAGHTLGRPWFAGRPVLVTENDRGLRLYNGDTGITVPSGDGLAVFVAEEERRRFAPSRLGAVQTAYAMTVHRSQGSQFDRVSVLLPDDDSRLLTRELLYTALTRAQSSVTLIGSEQAVRAAIGTRVLRASGLAERLAAALDSAPGAVGTAD